MLLTVALGCVWVGGYAFLLLAGVACLALVFEWLGLCGARGSRVALYGMGLTIVAATLCGGMGIPAIGLAFVLAGTLAATRWEGNPWTSGSRARFAHPAFHLALGFPYLGLAAVALPWLRADQDVGLANTLFVLALIWASDVGAYLTGRLIGGPRLAPAISPGKTWSGAIGGLLSAGLAGLAVAACFSSGFSPFHVTILAIGLGLVSQAGDLFESALKRRFGVKDSGRIIPGHGGMLDRLDALLAVAPVAALLAFSVGRGVVLWR